MLGTIARDLQYSVRKGISPVSDLLSRASKVCDCDSERHASDIQVIAAAFHINIAHGYSKPLL